MVKNYVTSRCRRLVDAFYPAVRSRMQRPGVRRRPALESLEGRALLASVAASAVVSSVADGADFDYTVNLTNSSASSAAIGTFWFAWVPGQDYLATNPLSVTPPPGWTEMITHSGATDGYAIQFLASSPASDVQPGSSLNFTFKSADTPASVDGNSSFYPGTKTATFFVYEGNFGDDGHEFVATAAPAAPPPSSTSPVTVTGVRAIENKRRMVTQVVISFSGPVNALEAESTTTYRLATAGKKGSFTARNAMVLKLKSAVYTTDAVTLTLRKAFALAKPVELVVNGQSLEDSSGQLIDGASDGQPGSNDVTIFRRNAAPTPAPPPLY